MWVKFTADMDYRPRPGVIIAYMAGMTLNVPRVAAAQAVAADKGVVVKRQKCGAPDDAET